jgi:hypothetical protein
VEEAHPAPRPQRPRLAPLQPTRQRLDTRGLGLGLRSHNAGAQCQALQGRKAERSGVGVSARRQKVTSTDKSSQETYDREVRRWGTYILEHTRAFFNRRPDEPCLGATRFKPANSGAAPLQTVASATTTRSLTCSGADPPPSASATVGIGSWPRRDEGHVNLRGPTAPDEQ